MSKNSLFSDTVGDLLVPVLFYLNYNMSISNFRRTLTGVIWYMTVLNLSVPYLFLFLLCSAKYSAALHIIFNIIEKVQKIQYLTLRQAAKIKYVYKYVRKKEKGRTKLEQEQIWNGFKMFHLVSHRHVEDM